MSKDKRKTPHHFKLVLLGDASVGKSCLVVRFAKEEFYENQEPTIGAAFMTQTVELEKPKALVKFEIWDTAGQERYRSLAPMYYRGAAAAVIVYDVTSRESFDGARSWVQELQGMASQESLVIALCGNKVDLVESNIPRQVEQEVARSYAQEQGILFLETSAKTGKNVKEVFHEIAKRLPINNKEKDPSVHQIGPGTQSTSSSGGCCGGGGS
mmetsp:Transcript_8132/g.19660  ORF Transcript_8132/g.19660 Transcript_8132/m.19660 type:complete len:212 (+) Transcript_8132:796-1431(+)|eukprot:CAMPEP_0178988534 /NCGR_PEP_ID=MMETSP0795-20121207/3861_1 /TAXON_ID=88552 /ORGANISM="Amoebophrya sp., Strain Ameob2" /LENGTH=211 /DNA_ID=CAMNT_0020679813 /DNA_START=733 /DNA_END=1368 /DNA_ORIENTATION=-